jgi:hypothetical protein
MADWLAFTVLGVLALVGGGLWAQRMLPPKLAGLLIAGLALRLVGSTARLAVIEQVYSGVGDAKMYFEMGRAYATLIRSLDFGFAFGEGTMNGQWWGTQFVRTVTGFVVFFTGDSMRAGFLAFSLFSFLGLVLCVRAFGRAFGEHAELKFARWVWLWPSLWFWPSSIGKEALMLLGAGITIWGYMGAGRARWLIVVMGLAVTGAVRPHIAAVTACALLAAESVGTGSLLNFRRIAGIVVAAALALYSLRAGLTQMGLGDSDLEGVQEHFEFRAGQTEQGGSKITASSGLAKLPMAFVNVLARPFLWEARGVQLLSALEMTIFWVLVFARRETAWAFLKDWRSNPFTRVGLVFVLGIALMYGMAFSNLGIIARQRSIILPYLLALVTGQLFESEPVVQQVTALLRPRPRLRVRA